MDKEFRKTIKKQSSGIVFQRNKVMRNLNTAWVWGITTEKEFREIIKKQSGGFFFLQNKELQKHNTTWVICMSMEKEFLKSMY